MAPSMYKTGFHKQTWCKKLFSQRLPEKIGASKYEIFSLIFEEVITHLVTETNRYAQQRNDHDFHVTRKEIDQFIRILFLSSYNSRQNTRDLLE